MARKIKRAAKRKPGRPWRLVIDGCVGQALGNSFRQQLLWILNEKVASPSELAKELGETLNKVCHHVKVLKNARCIEVAYRQTVGNRVQTFYKATSRAFLDGADWPKVPESLKEGLRATLLRNVLDDAIEAVVEGTFDSVDGSHLSWTPSIIDEQGREEMTVVLERALMEVMEIQDQARCRLAESGEVGTSYTVSILGYPSVLGMRTVRPSTDASELVEAASSHKASAKGRKQKRGVAKAPAEAKRAKPTSKRRTGKASAKAKRRKAGDK